RVLAIDKDDNAVTNARGNVRMNGCARIVVEKGGTDLAEGAGFDAILANIERNTLLHAMPALAAALAPEGNLLLSGFVRQDGEVLAQAAIRAGVTRGQELHEGEWACSQWTRTDKAGTGRDRPQYSLWPSASWPASPQRPKHRSFQMTRPPTWARSPSSWWMPTKRKAPPLWKPCFSHSGMACT